MHFVAVSRPSSAKLIEFMKGNPILRLTVILILLGAVFWPVFRITRRVSENSTESSASGIPSEPPITSTLRATLLLHTAPSPLRCSVSQHGITLLTEKNLIAPGEYRTAVEIIRGEDLIITAEWKSEEPHALRAEVLIHGYQVPLEKNFWAQRSLEDSFPIPDSLLPSRRSDAN